MESIKTAVMCIIAAGFIGSLALILTPGRKNDGVLKAIIGIFIVVSLFQPLSDAAKELLKISEKSIDTAEDIQSVSDDLNEALKDALSEEIYSRSAECAEKYGVEILSVTADISYDGEYIILHKICIKINQENNGGVEKFRNELERIIGAEVITEMV